MNTGSVSLKKDEIVVVSFMIQSIPLQQPQLRAWTNLLMMKLRTGNPGTID